MGDFRSQDIRITMKKTCSNKNVAERCSGEDCSKRHKDPIKDCEENGCTLSAGNFCSFWLRAVLSGCLFGPGRSGMQSLFHVKAHNGACPASVLLPVCLLEAG